MVYFIIWRFSVLVSKEKSSPEMKRFLPFGGEKGVGGRLCGTESRGTDGHPVGTGRSQPAGDVLFHPQRLPAGGLGVALAGGIFRLFPGTENGPGGIDDGAASILIKGRGYVLASASLGSTAPTAE